MNAVSVSTRTIAVPLTGPAWWQRLSARLLAVSLDVALAGGRPASQSRLLAIRAGQLAAPRARERLATAWLDLLERAGRPPTLADARMPLRRRRIRDAAPLIAELVDVLRSPRPVAPQGLAAARLLLAQGGSPVYATSPGGGALPDAIAAATRSLRLG